MEYFKTIVDYSGYADGGPAGPAHKVHDGLNLHAATSNRLQGISYETQPTDRGTPLGSEGRSHLTAKLADDLIQFAMRAANAHGRILEMP